MDIFRNFITSIIYVFHPAKKSVSIVILPLSYKFVPFLPLDNSFQMKFSTEMSLTFQEGKIIYFKNLNTIFENSIQKNKINKLICKFVC